MHTAHSSSRPGGSPPGTPPGPEPPWDQAPSPRGQTHTCKHITLPQTSFADGNKLVLPWIRELLVSFRIDNPPVAILVQDQVESDCYFQIKFIGMYIDWLWTCFSSKGSLIY